VTARPRVTANGGAYASGNHHDSRAVADFAWFDYQGSN
jgi:hypothetical protein